MDTGITLCQHNLSTNLIHLLKSATCHGNGVFGKGTSNASSGTTAKGVGVMMRHFNKVWRDLPDRLPGLLIDAAVSTQIAGVMVSYPLVSYRVKIKVS